VNENVIHIDAQIPNENISLYIGNNVIQSYSANIDGATLINITVVDQIFLVQNNYLSVPNQCDGCTVISITAKVLQNYSAIQDNIIGGYWDTLVECHTPDTDAFITGNAIYGKGALLNCPSFNNTFLPETELPAPPACGLSDFRENRENRPNLEL